MSKNILLLTSLLLLLFISGCSDDVDTVDSSATLPNALAFNPTEGIMPFPNDVAWSSTGGKVAFDPASTDDPASQALYKAVNAMEVNGLSPNAIIGIPLENDRLLDMATVKANLTIVTTVGVPFTAYEVVQDDSVLKIIPTTSFAADTQYVVILFAGMTDVNDKSLQQSFYYSLIAGTEEITGPLAALEPIRLSYEPLYTTLVPAITAGAKDANDVLELFTFTTADKTMTLTGFAAVAQNITGDIDDATLAAVVQGSPLPYAAITAEYAQIDAATDTALTAPTATTMTSLNFVSSELSSIPYTIFNGTEYTGATSPVIIYQHGLGGNRGHAQAIAVATGQTVIAIDLVGHGERVAATNDTTTGCDETVSGNCFLTTNLGQNRVNLYQSVFDMTVLLKTINNGNFDFDGDSAGDTPNNIYFAGQSMGSITGSMLSANDDDILDKVLLNVGGANFAALVDGASNSEITALVEAFGVTKNSTLYFVTMGLLQLLQDPCDPIYQANIANDAITVIQTAHEDTVVPNISNTILSGVVSSASKTAVADFANDAAPGTAGWYHYGNSDALFDNWINHGFLLSVDTTGYPEAEGLLNDDYLADAQTKAYNQMIQFFANP